MTFRREWEKNFKYGFNVIYFIITDRLLEVVNWCSDQVFAKFEGALEKKWGPVTEMTFFKGSLI